MEPWLSNGSQVEQFRVWPKNWVKNTCDQTNVRSSNTWAELMKMECAQTTAEANWHT